MKKRYIRKMTAALLAAAIVMTAAQGMAASEESLHAQAEAVVQQEAAEPASQPEPAKAPSPQPEPAKTPAPQPEPAKTPSPQPEPAKAPAPQPEPAKTPSPQPEPAQTPATQPEPAKEPENAEKPEQGDPAGQPSGEAEKQPESSGLPADKADLQESGQEEDMQSDPGSGQETQDLSESESGQETQDLSESESGQEEEQASVNAGPEDGAPAAAGTDVPEDGQETMAAAAEDAADASGEGEDAGTTDLGLDKGKVSIAEDYRGAFIEYDFKNTQELLTTLTITLLSDGSPAGTPIQKTVKGDEYNLLYLLGLASNPFHLTADDIGKTVSVRIEAENAAGKQTVDGAGSVLLRFPTISMPSVVRYSTGDTAKDMYDGRKVSGVTFDPGSFQTELIVEKISGDGSSAVSGDQVLTGADAGTYQIRVHTILGDILSNQFLYAVPVTGLSVDGDLRIGSKLTAAPEGVDGYPPTGLTYAWTVGGETGPVSTEAACTPPLRAFVEAQTLSLSLLVRDAIGNEYEYGMELGPLDLSKTKLRAGSGSLVYNGESQIPSDDGIFLGDYRIPESLYRIEPAKGKNTTNAGQAWMQLTGTSAYLTGACLVGYQIAKAELDLTEGDFVRSFAYDGNTHSPVLSKDADPETGVKLRYRYWKQKSGSSWVSISGAPSLPGKYRVRVTVVPKDGNYQKQIFKKMEFSITGEVPKEQGAPDLTVTDTAGNPKPYKVRVIPQTDINPEADPLMKDAPEKDPVPMVYEISAEPDTAPAEGASARERLSAYSQRCLRIDNALIRKANGAGCSFLRFVLCDAVVETDLAALKSGTAYMLYLAPLKVSELTPAEEEALTGYETPDGLYAVRMSHAAETKEEITRNEMKLTLYLPAGQDRENQGSVLFLKKDRRESQSVPEAVLLEGTLFPTDGRITWKTELDGAGIFSINVL